MLPTASDVELVTPCILPSDSESFSYYYDVVRAHARLLTRVCWHDLLLCASCAVCIVRCVLCALRGMLH